MPIEFIDPSDPRHPVQQSNTSIRDWALNMDHVQRTKGSGIHHEMAVYVVASRALDGEYGSNPDFKRLNSELPAVASSIDSASTEERLPLYGIAWTTMMSIVREVGVMHPPA